MKKLSRYLFLILCIGAITSSMAQLSKQYQKEKIYLHTNHVFFKQGESLFFKLYLVNGTDHRPSALSKIAYVEIISPSGTVAEKQSYKVENGYAEGAFTISENAVGGLYKIKAYTSWMMNEKEATFFTKEFTVQKVITPRLLMKLDFPEKGYGPGSKVSADFSIKSLDNKPLADYTGNFVVAIDGVVKETKTLKADAEGKAKIVFSLPKDLATSDGLLTVTFKHDSFVESISRSIPIVLHKIDLQFMPEGGNMVAGMETVVAFKAVNEFGKPVDVKGVVTDDKGNTIANFESYKFGMGKFKLLPAYGLNYKASLVSHKNNNQQYTLPKVAQEGVTLRITKQNEKITLQINSSSSKEIILTGKSKEITYYTKSLSLKKGLNEFTIEERLFPVGIAQFTLAAKTGEPLAERLLFLNGHKQLSVTITADKQNYLPREKVKLTIVTKDEGGKPIPSNLSLAVVDDKLWSFADDKQNHILSWLLLSSELKGKIEEPQFYFKKNEPKAAIALDLLMLTQGYRYFDFIETVAESKQLKFGFGENITVLGKVVDEREQHVSTDVFLIENVNNGKVVQLKTAKDGLFYFQSLDRAGDYLVLAKGKKRQKIKIMLLQTGLNYSFQPSDLVNLTKREFNEGIGEIKKAKTIEKQQKREEKAFLFGNDEKGLNEVVVVAYGGQLKRNIAGSVATVTPEQINNVDNGVVNALQGKIAGLVVKQQANPGAAPVVQIRGAGSLPGNNEPLLIIDGVAMGKEGLNQIDINDINTITVLKDAAAVAVYGFRASNGVILITSKTNGHRGRLKWDVTGKAKFEMEYVKVTGPQFTAVKKFYVPVYQTPQTSERTDFRETIYWNPVVQTDKNGTAKVEFYNSDATTTFRAMAEGIGYNGMLGNADFTYATINQLNVDVKIPPYLTVGDKVKLPLVIKNNSRKTLVANIAMNLPAGISAGHFTKQISIARDSSKLVLLPITVEQKVTGNIQFKVTAEGESEALTLPISAYPKGFPIIETFSGNQSAVHQFTISKMIEGTLIPKLSLYKDVEGQLVNGIESMLREPYGCFEQTSSTTYPNVFILKYLKQVGKSNPAIEEKALNYLKNGYKRLVGYETAENGFEWFGKTPAHEALTAYGLLEFTAMKEFVEVDEAMLKRTKDFLLKRRNGRGGFRLATGGYDKFASVPGAIANVYIVYAITAAGFGKEITNEYQTALADVLMSNDSYQLALMALAASNLKNTADYTRLMDALNTNYKQHNLYAATSVVNSRDASLRVETMSLYALALMRGTNPDLALVAKLISKIMNEKSYYGYGSTQATVMALDAVVEYAKLNQKQLLNNEVVFVINGKQLNENEALDTYLVEGKNTFSVRYKNEGMGVPYNLEVAYQTFTPPTAAKASLSITTSLSSSTVNTSETVRMTVAVTNKENALQAMSTAKIGVPGGLSIQAWQLKELMEKGQIAYYEIFDNYLVLYWMGFAAKETKNIHLDLKADIPGVYKAKASNVYLYYTPEYKYWNEGLNVVVK